MKRFVPHYTCKRPEQSGITCINLLMDYFKETRFFEKKIKDFSEFATNVNKKLLREGIFNFPSFEQMNKILVHNNFRVKLFRKELDENSDLPQVVTEDIDKELVEKLKKKPVMMLMNLNALYGEKNSNLGYIIVLEHNKVKNEFIIYDPMYYNRISKTRNYERLDNTPKRRYISVKRVHFLKSWSSIEDLLVFLNKKNSIKPFKKEFITITNSNT